MAVDKYQAAVARSQKTHDEAMEIIKRILSPKYGNDVIMNRVLKVLDADGKEGDIVRRGSVRIVTCEIDERTQCRMWRDGRWPKIVLLSHLSPQRLLVRFLASVVTSGPGRASTHSRNCGRARHHRRRCQASAPDRNGPVAFDADSRSPAKFCRARPVPTTGARSSYGTAGYLGQLLFHHRQAWRGCLGPGRCLRSAGRSTPSD